MEVKEIPIKEIEILENIRQRPTVPDDLAELMNSIKGRGLLQPIGVVEEKGKYILLWGFRRMTACKKLGYKTISAKIYQPVEIGELTMENLLIINATENIHRKATNLIELGRICRILKKDNSVSEIASKLSIPKSRIEMALDTMSRLPEKYRESVYVFTAKDSRDKKGRLSASLVNGILNLRGVTQIQRESIMDWARKEEKSVQQISVLGEILKTGMSLKEAKNKVDEYRIAFATVPVSLKMYKETVKKRGDFIALVKKLLNQYKTGFTL